MSSRRGNFHVRKATIDDLDGILAVQQQSYDVHLVEDAVIFKSILEFGLSYVAETLIKDTHVIIGFLLAHPSQLDHIYLLHESPILDSYDPFVFFIHDVSVLPNYRGRSVGTSLYIKFWRHVKELLRHRTPGHKIVIQIISVNHSEPFWRSLGFIKTMNVSMNAIQKLNYGGNCTHMSFVSSYPR